ncbi:MAG: WXG100 family type VII secretion target [bacterium]|nr:WXG100 family type VII secretion target [bacterium]
MAYTFAVDTEKIEALKKNLETARTDIETKIPTIFDDIGNMEKNNDWSGTSYNSFSDGAEKYKNALNTLPQVINVFETELGTTIKENANTLIEEIGTEISNMLQD